MGAGVVYVDRYNRTDMLFCGLVFFVLALITLALGMLIKHRTLPGRHDPAKSKPSIKSPPEPKSLQRRRKRRIRPELA